MGVYVPIKLLHLSTGDEAIKIKQAFTGEVAARSGSTPVTKAT